MAMTNHGNIPSKTQTNHVLVIFAVNNKINLLYLVSGPTSTYALILEKKIADNHLGITLKMTHLGQLIVGNQKFVLFKGNTR